MPRAGRAAVRQAEQTLIRQRISAEGDRRAGARLEHLPVTDARHCGLVCARERRPGERKRKAWLRTCQIAGGSTHREAARPRRRARAAGSRWAVPVRWLHHRVTRHAARGEARATVGPPCAGRLGSNSRSFRLVSSPHHSAERRRLPKPPAGHRRRRPDQDLQFRRQPVAAEHEGRQPGVALQHHQVIAGRGCDQDQRREPGAVRDRLC